MKVYKIRLKGLKKYTGILLTCAWTSKSLSAGFFYRMLSFELKFVLSTTQSFAGLEYTVGEMNVMPTFAYLKTKL